MRIWSSSRFEKWIESKAGHFQHIPICEASACLADVYSIRESIWGIEQGPIDNGFGREANILVNVGNPVQVVSVERLGGYEKTTRLLQYSPNGFRIDCAVFFTTIEIETEAGS
ncbi:unnamed protein product [Clonostachys chloroleuca]|uniref:Uncharacterized protein n=1 Tax=Clonostachys chloroleuca TaxID=1926264 RepID=A0AA35M1T7_9HYPO|nr:unnamed protein product [Clonostachys chloroleuca]